MSNSFHFKILQLIYDVEVDGKKNVVNTISWVYEATDGENTTSLCGTKNIQLNPLQFFTEYEDLTEKQVINWLVLSLGDQIQEMQNQLSRRLEEIKAPKTGSGLPWEK